MIVLDASAILAVAHKEPGAAKVLAKRSELMGISSVNYAEALQKVVQHGGSAPAYTTDKAWKQWSGQLGVHVADLCRDV